MDFLSKLALLVHLLSEEITGRDELPAEVLGQEEGVLLSEGAWWSHQEDSFHFTITKYVG